MYSLIDSSVYIPSGMLSSFKFDVITGSICFSLSSVHGDGLSIFEIASQSIFSIVTRDKFGNVRTEDLQHAVISIIYDSISKPIVIPLTLKPEFNDVSILINAGIASGHCRHYVGSHIGILF